MCSLLQPEPHADRSSLQLRLVQQSTGMIAMPIFIFSRQPQLHACTPPPATAVNVDVLSPMPTRATPTPTAWQGVMATDNAGGGAPPLGPCKRRDAS
jgi:hypothetical protein